MRFAYGRPFDKLKSESEKERKIRIGRSLKLSHSVEEWTIGVISWIVYVPNWGFGVNIRSREDAMF